MRRRAGAVAGVFVAALAAAAGVLSVATYHELQRQQRELSAVAAAQRAQAAELQAVAAAARDVAPLVAKLGATEKRLQRERGALARLARGVLRSVFTVRTNTGWMGAGFLAWRDESGLYLLTANHVVERATNNFVTVSRTRGSWSGEIVGTDAKNDLALVRVSGRPAGSGPALWQRPEQDVVPRVGEDVMLVGSPYGLEGTVTVGIVSRVTRRVIQTDAAANPGNSGGPAIDRRGRIIGVLVSGGGQNLNFIVPIRRACLALRHC